MNKRGREGRERQRALNLISHPPLSFFAAVISNSEKRFSDFVALYETVRMMYGGSHLAKNIPPPPGKQLKMTTDHLSQNFLDDRKEKLDNFMKKLSDFPGIMGVPGIQGFCGLDSV
jgi:hypothetical protein